jgi:hypothetical protein
MIGKPYSGKPNVRFDEGELEIEPFGYYASSLLYCNFLVSGETSIRDSKKEAVRVKPERGKRLKAEQKTAAT